MLRKNKKAGYAAAIILCGLLSACTSAEQPTPKPAETPQPMADTYQPIHKQGEQTTAVPVKPVTREKASIAEKGQKAEKHRNTPPKTAAAVAVEPSVAYQAATILFADGSAVIASEYDAEIRYIARLAKCKNAHITVYGFSSSRTRNTDMATHKMINFQTSLKRAENVAAALIRAGVPQKSVAVEALSDSQPLYREIMPEGERLNRRAEIYISY